MLYAAPLAVHGGSLLHPALLSNSLFIPSGATEPQMVSSLAGLNRDPCRCCLPQRSFHL